MYLQTLLISLLQVTAFVLVGMYVAKKGIILKDGFTQITAFLMKIVFPCKLIMSGNVQYSVEIWHNIQQVLLVSTIYMASGLILARLLFLLPILPRDRIGQGMLAATFSNAGFIGFPLALALYGEEGLLYAMVYNIMFNIFFHTSSAYLLSPKGSGGKFKKSSVFSPLTIFSVAALILFVSPWRIPGEVTSVLKSIGDMTTPLTMILIGSWMVGVNWKRVFTNRQGYCIVFLRLLLYPILMLAAFKLFHVEYTMAMAVCVMVSALPVGSLSVIMSERYGHDVVFANETLILSMILCLPTIFLVMQLGQVWL